MKLFLIYLIALVLFCFVLVGLTFIKETRAEGATFPHCTNTSLDKYIYKNGCI